MRLLKSTPGGIRQQAGRRTNHGVAEPHDVHSRDAVADVGMSAAQVGERLVSKRLPVWSSSHCRAVSAG